MTRRTLLAAARNPVLANDAPDPSVIRGPPDGAYYAYTRAYFGAEFVNVPILRSTDLVSRETRRQRIPGQRGLGSRLAGRDVGPAHPLG